MFEAPKLCDDWPTMARLTVFDCEPGDVSMPCLKCPKSFATSQPLSSRMPLGVKPAILYARAVAYLVPVERLAVGGEAEDVALGEFDRLLAVCLELRRLVERQRRRSLRRP